jgi:hypothetical protein
MPSYRKGLVAVSTFAPEQWRVTQAEETERPFANEYWDNKDRGLHVDALSEEPLFASFGKFDGGTESPSFKEAACAIAAVGVSEPFFTVDRATARPHLNFPTLEAIFCPLRAPLLFDAKADCKQQFHDSNLQQRRSLPFAYAVSGDSISSTSE